MEVPLLVAGDLFLSLAIACIEAPRLMRMQYLYIYVYTCLSVAVACILQQHILFAAHFATRSIVSPGHFLKA